MLQKQLRNQLYHRRVHHANDDENHLYEYIQYNSQALQDLFVINDQQYQDDAKTMRHEYTCLNTDDTAVREARRSFFSGHTAPIFFGFGWLIMYIHVSWSWRHLGILGHLLQIGILILGLYVGYTRITDFHHHWQDVCVGAVVGSLVAFVCFKFILNWRNYTTRFLPYTVKTVKSTSPFSPNGGIPMNDSRRVGPQTNQEYNAHF